MSFSAFSQDSTFAKLDPTKKVLNVEAACGQCQFKMNGKEWKRRRNSLTSIKAK